jgi:hypothetical protein
MFEQTNKKRDEMKCGLRIVDTSIGRFLHSLGKHHQHLCGRVRYHHILKKYRIKSLRTFIVSTGYMAKMEMQRAIPAAAKWRRASLMVCVKTLIGPSFLMVCGKGLRGGPSSLVVPVVLAIVRRRTSFGLALPRGAKREV